MNIEMLDSCLSRLQKIGDRHPLPTQHFFKEAQEIIRGAVLEAYEAGVEDGKNDKTTFPVDNYSND